jgi:hypothetical protein
LALGSTTRESPGFKVRSRPKVHLVEPSQAPPKLAQTAPTAGSVGLRTLDDAACDEFAERSRAEHIALARMSE